MHSIVPPNGIEGLWLFALLYFSPDSIMPLASLIAGAIGLVLIFWRQIARLARKAYRFTRERMARAPSGGAAAPGSLSEPADEQRHG